MFEKMETCSKCHDMMTKERVAVCSHCKEESPRSPGCSTASLREDYDKLKAAASCVQHWHDTANDGMIVSGEHVRGLWAVLAEIQ